MADLQVGYSARVALLALLSHFQFILVQIYHLLSIAVHDTCLVPNISHELS